MFVLCRVCQFQGPLKHLTHSLADHGCQVSHRSQRGRVTWYFIFTHSGRHTGSQLWFPLMSNQVPDPDFYLITDNVCFPNRSISSNLLANFKRVNFTFFFLTFVYFVGRRGNTKVNVQRSEETWGSQFPPSTMEGLGREHGSSGLAAKSSCLSVSLSNL